MNPRTPDKRARDARLAWIIVGICAPVSMAVIGIGLYLAAEHQLKDMRRGEIASSRHGADVQQAEIEALNPGPPPPDTTEPVDDIATWFGPDAYPAGALRRGETGRVRVTVAVDRDGLPTGCQTYRSSGSYSLDLGTCDIVRQHRFTGVGSDGPMTRRWTTPYVRWVLPDE